MTTFNQNFFQANRKYTKEMAEAKMIANGYSNYSFDNYSYANGASFYFTLEDGRKVRVSDHPLTGKRVFEYIQISFVEPKLMTSKPVIAGIVYKKRK